MHNVSGIIEGGGIEVLSFNFVPQCAVSKTIFCLLIYIFQSK
jgi:hypothetical protein